MGFARQRCAEIMDSPALDEPRHLHALDALARINRVSRTVPCLWAAIGPWARRHREGPVGLLDLACGGGDVALGVESRARQAGLDVRTVGCDASPVAIGRARRRAAELGSEASFMRLDVLQDPLPEGADIVFSTLFLHHLSAGDAVELLRRMAAVAAHRVVVLDLERTRLGYLLAHAGVRLLTTSDVARHDGPTSVRAAFTRAEAWELARQAGLNATVRAHWPQRYSLTWART